VCIGSTALIWDNLRRCFPHASLIDGRSDAAESYRGFRRKLARTLTFAIDGIEAVAEQIGRRNGFEIARGKILYIRPAREAVWRVFMDRDFRAKTSAHGDYGAHIPTLVEITERIEHFPKGRHETAYY